MFGFALMGAIVIALAISFFWLRPAKVSCPECKNRRVIQIEQTVEAVRPYDLISGEGGGKMLMMEIKETFRCRQCDHIWTKKRIEA